MKRVELTLEAFKSCREKPSTVLLTKIMEMSAGEEIEIVGEEEVFPLKLLERLLDAEGVDVLEKDSDGITYRVKGKKR
ncbi:MAG: hypothetical protein F7B95_04180 [Desulfurococcales archaeon]|nr:hypothetical protein [Desulfurococcales archaeon]